RLRRPSTKSSRRAKRKRPRKRKRRRRNKGDCWTRQSRFRVPGHTAQRWVRGCRRVGAALERETEEMEVDRRRRDRQESRRRAGRTKDVHEPQRPGGRRC